MKSRKGFTLVELMVVVVIVAILAALLIPLLTARIEAARWAEGKAGAGTIAVALRAYVAEAYELETGFTASDIAIEDFMSLADLTGKYFDAGDYTLDVTSYDPSVVTEGGHALIYEIHVGVGTVDSTITWQKTDGYTLYYDGEWVYGTRGG